MEPYMEIGESGLVPQQNGWFYNANTDKYISPEGEEYDPEDYETNTKNTRDM